MREQLYRFDEEGNITHKICSRCRELKPRNMFGNHSGRPLGIMASCKACRITEQKPRMKRKTKRVKAFKKKYMATQTVVKPPRKLRDQRVPIALKPYNIDFEDYQVIKEALKYKR